jgi:hypothetical protein
LAKNFITGQAYHKQCPVMRLFSKSLVGTGLPTALAPLLSFGQIFLLQFSPQHPYSGNRFLAANKIKPARKPLENYPDKSKSVILLLLYCCGNYPFRDS